MSEVSLEASYSLFQKGIIGTLRDRETFVMFMAYNLMFVARRWGCHVHVNRLRLEEAFDFWVEDTTRVLAERMPPETQELDDFKHAGFIAFWLRRRIPVEDVEFLTVRKFLEEDEDFFLGYCNEICAFTIGLWICTFYQSHTTAIEGNVQSLRDNRLNYLQACTIDFPLFRDIVVTLKHKNVSPHDLYLIYRSLFAVIRPS